MGIGEILWLALTYTLLGMGTVFAILIFISICIWILGLLTKNQRTPVAAAAAPAAVPDTSAPADDEGIRPEIIAAITAVIHQHIMEENAGAEDFDGEYVIRNVRRAQWKHIS